MAIRRILKETFLKKFGQNIFNCLAVNAIFQLFPLYVFVCVEVLRPSQPNGVMSSAVSLPNHTFPGQA